MIPPILLNSIKNGTCLPVIGAGFSKNAMSPEGEKIPDWDELKTLMKSQLDTLEDEPLAIATEFELKFQRSGLLQLLEESIPIGKLKPDHVHRYLIRIQDFDVICTTNFDLLLEDACKQEQRDYKKIVTPEQLVLHGASKQLKIFKMHGDLEYHNQLIISKKDYADYDQNHKLFKTYLTTLLSTRTPLYIGFSMKDPNFNQFKRYVENVTGPLNRKGFIIQFNPDKNTIDAYQKMNLEVIPLITNGRTYGESLLDFLQEIQNPPIQLDKQIVVSPEQNVEFSVSANRTILFYGQTLLIRTNSDPKIENKIKITVKDQNGSPILHGNTKDGITITDGIRQLEFVLKGSDWKEENYTIYAEYGGKIASDSFRLSKPREIVAQTDRTIYMYGNNIIFTTIVPQASIDSDIYYKIFNSDKKIIHKGKITVDSEETGIYQTLIPVEGEEWRKRGEEILIEAKYGDKSAQVTIFTSNFGATVELDQKVYSWTDKVFITIVAPDFAIDQEKHNIIGIEEDGKIIIFTNKGKLENYKFIETGPDTGIFVGEINLTGFAGHPIDSLSTKKYPLGITRGSGPTNGLLSSDDDDGITVSFKFSEDETIVGSALIRWNIGEIFWLEPRYVVDDDAIIRVIDPDMNLNSNEIDSFKIHVWSDSDKIGIDVIVYETESSSGIFESIISLTKDNSSIYGKLKVSKGDKIYAKYIDNTLPHPYSKSDFIEIIATAEIVSKIERKSSNSEK